MDIFAIAGFSLGALGFIFGVSALTQVNSIKNKLESLKRKTEKRRN